MDLTCVGRWMTPVALVVAVVLCLAGGPAWAQSGDPGVDAAREAYIAGDYEAAVAVLAPAAEAGNPTAQNIMGAAFEDGNGVPRDPARALEWYEAAAAQGYDKALFNLGLIYRDGLDPVAPDLARAVGYFQQAVALDYWAAYAALAEFYETGVAVERDETEAARLNIRGMDLGDPNAANNLGQMYHDGRGVLRDFTAARAAWARAGDLGLPQGYNNLGILVESGAGGPQDLDRAMALYLRAMTFDYGLAANNAAQMVFAYPDHFNDPVRGLALCLWSVPRAEPDRVEAFEADCAGFEATMTPEQIAAARQMSLEL